jgi:hypothetical protein
MKRTTIVQAVIILLVLISLFLGYVHRSPEEEARRRCAEAGWDASGLHAERTKWTNWPILRHAEVDLVGFRDGMMYLIHVELHQPVYFLPWKVVEYSEEIGPRW